MRGRGITKDFAFFLSVSPSLSLSDWSFSGKLCNKKMQKCRLRSSCNWRFSGCGLQVSVQRAKVEMHTLQNRLERGILQLHCKESSAALT
ncbi:UNVERIFIED_CONTAM: hypothetical protein FKN15_059889 [Acipenser sinensis]